MIIGLPIDKEAISTNTAISESLTDASALFIHDTDTKSSKHVLLETLLAHHETESLLEALSREKVGVLICPEIFALAYKASREAGIEVFKAETLLLGKNISLFKKGELNPFTFNSAKSSGCSTDCSSCGESDCKSD